MRRSTFYLAMLLLWLTASGAACPRRVVNQQSPMAPIAFVAPPSLDQLMATINDHTGRVRQLQSTNASLDVQGAPTLKASLAVERPLHFRLQASTSLTGAELDMGSNDERFWFWAKRNDPPSVYFARHDQFQSSRAAEVFPVPPQWLIEALGLVEFRPTDQHQGPNPAAAGRLAIESLVHTAQGDVTRVVMVDDQRAYVTQQMIYDSDGQLLAAAIASDHKFYADHQVTLPQRVDIRFPQADMAFTLEFGDLVINQLSGDPTQLWQIPQLEQYQYVDLSSPYLSKTQPILPVSGAATVDRKPPMPEVADRWYERYRGF